MADSLSEKKCIPCEGGIPHLSDTEIKSLLPQVPGWGLGSIIDEGKTVETLQKRFQFKNFREAMAFLREVEELAEAEGHHPDFCVHYNKVDFTIWTHAISGLHENDFIMASKINELNHGS